MEKKHLLFVLDDGYVQQLLVTLNSIFKNNNGEGFAIHIVYSRISDNNLAIIENFVGKNKAELSRYKIDDSILNTDFMVGTRWSSIVYYKLIGIFGLRGVSRVLYLDCDTIVDGNLDELFEIEFEDNYALAVEDTGLEQVLWDKLEHYRKLKLSYDFKYINAGVLMLNLQKIQEETSLEFMLECFRKLSKRLIFNEQDLINVLWQDKIKLVDHKYNRVATDFSYRKKIGKDKDVVIYHYTINKPWSTEMKDNPYAYSWCLNKYLEYTDFEECRELKRRIKKNNKGICTVRKVKGIIKSRFAINYGKPLLSGKWTDYLLYKI